MLDIHSFSQLVLWPYGYTGDQPIDHEVYQQIGFTIQSLIYDVHGFEYSAGSGSSMLYLIDGGAKDWVYDELFILSMAFELRDKGQYGFLLQPDQIIPNNEEVLPAILYMTGAEWELEPIRFRFPDDIPSAIQAGTDTVIPLEIVARPDAIVTSEARVHYHYDVNGPFINVPLTPTGGEAYEAMLPATNCLLTPEFYFSAQNSAGASRTDPPGAPAVVRSLKVYSDVTVVVVANLEEPSSWRVGDVNDDAYQGIWEWGVPERTNYQPGADHTPDFPGEVGFCYITGAEAQDDLLWDGSVLGGKTTLFSRMVDLSRIEHPVFSYWRFYRTAGVTVQKDDVFTVDIYGGPGTGWINVETIGPFGTATNGGWFKHEFHVTDFLENPPPISWLRLVASEYHPPGIISSVVEAAIDDFEVKDMRCVPLFGDYGGDDDVDEDDFDAFWSCFAGLPLVTGCAIFDFDADDDLDCDDWAYFEAAWTGAGVYGLPAVCGSDVQGADQEPICLVHPRAIRRSPAGVPRYYGRESSLPGNDRHGKVGRGTRP